MVEALYHYKVVIVICPVPLPQLFWYYESWRNTVFATRYFLDISETGNICIGVCSFMEMPRVYQMKLVFTNKEDSEINK